MAGHIQDRWYKNVTEDDGTTRRVKSDRYGSGKRYRARYVGPDGTEKSQSFADKQKRQAEQWLVNVEADMARGQYVDPRSGRVTVQQHAERWLASLGGDAGTFVSTERRIRLHVVPHIGRYALAALRPVHIREWLRALQDQGLSDAYQRVIFANLCTMLTAAVDDRMIAQNPCLSSSVRTPRVEPRRLVPWTQGRVMAVRAALPEQYRAVVDVAGGCGMRQGEVLGLAVDQVDPAAGLVHVVRQVKLIRNTPVFAPPKSGKSRTVPLPESVADALDKHMVEHPSASVTLPWRAPDGPPVTAVLLFTGHTGAEVNRNTFNRWAWRKALKTADVPYGRENGMHALRHFYASVLLDAGESIKALSEYLGHHDPGFTLRTYTHLMPSSETRTREAVNRAFDTVTETNDGPETAQEGDQL